jgi:hypothetical protein
MPRPTAAPPVNQLKKQGLSIRTRFSSALGFSKRRKAQNLLSGFAKATPQLQYTGKMTVEKK